MRNLWLDCGEQHQNCLLLANVCLMNTKQPAMASRIRSAGGFKLNKLGQQNVSGAKGNKTEWRPERAAGPDATCDLFKVDCARSKQTWTRLHLCPLATISDKHSEVLGLMINLLSSDFFKPVFHLELSTKQVTGQQTEQSED